MGFWAILVAVSLLTACTSGREVTSMSDNARDGVLTVSQVWQKDAGIATIVHVEIVHYPDDSEIPEVIKVLDEMTPVPREVIDQSVAPGSYEIRAFTRRCLNSTCAEAVSPELGCAARTRTETITVDVVVDFDGATPCAMSVEGGPSDIPDRDMELTLTEPGGANCEPPSSIGRGDEMLATTRTKLVAWGLLLADVPIVAGEEVKLVVRLSDDDDDIRASATSGIGSTIDPTWGPKDHGEAGSNYGRPGREWGMAFIFPEPGCWQVELATEAGESSFWIEVGS